MPNTITITTAASVADIDGQTITVPSSNYVIQTDDVVEFTRDINTTATIIWDITYQFAMVVNNGAVDVLVEVLAGDRYALFVVPPYAHAIIPSVVHSSTGIPTAVTNMAAYTASGTGRAFFFIAK